MAISVSDIIGLIRDLVSDGDKLAKFREIISDLKELVADVKGLIKG